MDQISEIVRRDIIDELRSENLVWSGRLTEIDFVSRIWNIDELPSSDSRYKTFEADWRQHRVNNYDWEYDWVYTDNRLNLIKSSDDIFLKFLCTLIHPVVRKDQDEKSRLLHFFNENLACTGWEIVEKKNRFDRSEFLPVKLDPIVIEIENENKLSNYEFALQQLKKCEEKLSRGDYDGAITSSRSFLEGVFADIYKQATNVKLNETGNLIDDYKKVKFLLNLSENNQANDALRGIAKNFTGIIHGIDTLSNKIGDRHRPISKPARHHAKLVINSAKTIVDFLYDTMEYQKSRFKNIENILLATLGGEKRFYSYEELHNDADIKALMETCDSFMKNQIKDDLTKNAIINSFQQSDIFFACMQLFLSSITSEDVIKIYDKFIKNTQAVGLKSFLKEVYSRMPEVLKGNSEILQYIEIQ